MKRSLVHLAQHSARRVQRLIQAGRRVVGPVGRGRTNDLLRLCGPDLFKAALNYGRSTLVMTAEQACRVELQVRNDSPVTWPGPSGGASPIRVSYHWRCANGEVYASEGLRTDLPVALRPGDTTEVSVQVRPPNEHGYFTLEWDLVCEPATWFSSHGWEGPVASVRVDPRRWMDDAEAEAAQVLESLRRGPMKKYLRLSSEIPGWIRGREARAIAHISHSLPEAAVIVEIGAFLGSSTILLAGARQLRGSGKVHSVDPFDGSGDEHSVPVYEEILSSLGGGSPRQRFEDNLRRAGLAERVAVHQGFAVEVAATWKTPIDLLFLDGDQSPRGARAAYESWVPFLKPGGTIAVHNSKPEAYAEGHDGNRRLVLDEILPPKFCDIRLIGRTTLARKATV